jgi:hypothetical protein
MSSKLGEMLLSKKVISDAQLKTALETQKQVAGSKLGLILVKLRYLTEEQLATFLGEQLKIPVFKLKDLVLQPAVSALVDVEVLKKHQVIPIRKTGESLLVAAVDPLDLDFVDELQFLTGLRVDVAAASRTDIIRAIDYYFNGKPCPEIREAEKARGIASGQHQAVAAGTRASPQLVLQAVVELLIEKKLISREEVLSKVSKG